MPNETKHCGGCGQDLPLSSFWKNRAMSDGLQRECKNCLRSRQKKYYQTPEGKEHRRKRNATASARAARKRYAASAKGREAANKATRKFAAQLRKEARALLRAAKDVPCADCGDKFHFAAMDFDHVRGEKKGCLSTMASKITTLDTLLEEMAKCEVVCANCHRVRTYHRKTALKEAA